MMSFLVNHLIVNSVDEPLLVNSHSLGYVQGFANESVRVFRGIPYAQAPVFDLRLRPPQPLDRNYSRLAPLDATKFAPTCMQRVYVHDGKQSGMWPSIDASNTSEDCLFLNIYSPIKATKLPVMVYFHAGEYRAGSANDEENNWPYFSPDVILVTVNSRLGAFGYSASDHLRNRSPDNSTGNYGIQDQRMSLRFICNNIEAFGGDPTNVLIFGESSGGAQVGVHMTNPRSFGLFHKIVLESAGLTQVKPWDLAVLNHDFFLTRLALLGSPHCKLSDPPVFNAYPDVSVSGKHIASSSNLSLAGAEKHCLSTNCTAFTASVTSTGTTYAFYLSPFLHRQHDGADTPVAGRGTVKSTVTSYARAAQASTYEEEMACVLGAHADMILEAQGPTAPYSDTFFTDSYGPAIDGVEMKRSVVSSIKAGGVAPGVSAMVGSNLDEGTLFMGVTPTLARNATLKEFSAWCTTFFGEELGPKVPALYAHLDLPLPPVHLPAPYNRSGAGRYWAAAMRAAGDYAIACPARVLAKRVAAAAAAAASSTSSSAALAPATTAFNYLFTQVPRYSMNYDDTASLGSFHGAEVAFVFGDAWELTTPDEKSLSKAMGCFWAAFARTGDPNAGTASGAACSTVAWPRYVLNSTSSTLQADSSIRLGSPLTQQVGHKAGACDLFERFLQ